MVFLTSIIIVQVANDWPPDIRKLWRNLPFIGTLADSQGNRKAEKGEAHVRYSVKPTRHFILSVLVDRWFRDCCIAPLSVCK